MRWPAGSAMLVPLLSPLLFPFLVPHEVVPHEDRAAARPTRRAGRAEPLAANER